MKIKATILVELNKPLEVIELEIPTLKPGQVLVEIALSGVCHTQILEARGRKGPDPYVPHCMGHEGIGVVREISSGVSKVQSGDKVLLSWIKGAGMDIPGTVYSWNDKKVNAGAITTFSSFSIISENRLTKLPKEISPRAGAFIGCAGATGLGVVWNTIGAQPGNSLAVFGCGGIGLLAVAGARLAGCTTIVAVDINPMKLELARSFGATHVLNPQSDDITTALKQIVPRGLDYAVEATGKTAVMRQAFEAVRQQGGIAAVVGNAAAGDELIFDPKLLNMGKQLRGTWGGDTVPERDFPRYFETLKSGRLDLSPLVSKEYSLEQINSALDDLEEGTVARPLLVLNESIL